MLLSEVINYVHSHFLAHIAPSSAFMINVQNLTLLLLYVFCQVLPQVSAWEVERCNVRWEIKNYQSVVHKKNLATARTPHAVPSLVIFNGWHFKLSSNTSITP